MKKMLLLVVVLASFGWAARAEQNPKANPEAVVEAGNARFTVLTSQLIRMEWAEDGVFEDRATLTFVNRNLPVPQFRVRENKRRVEIRTEHLTLTYEKGARFSAENLSATFRMGEQTVVWHFGDRDSLNLMGTTRTLDGADGWKLKAKDPMEPGLLSRGGWSVVDDSKRHLLQPVDSHWKEWVTTRPEGDRLDLYLFAYGHDYTQALHDYTQVAGRIPLPPKYAFGYWWSRYWLYSDYELRELVGQMRSFDIPLDVLVVDMDWHETWGLRKKNPRLDDYKQRVGWTGYTWKKELFPSPENFLKWSDREQLQVSLNLHPASGIQPYEAPYEAFVEAYGWPQKGKSVPFKIDDAAWADAYFKTVLGPMEQQGVDFWWLDWQQWRDSRFTKGLSNTFWLNHVFYHHAASLGDERPMIYHRWGGLGSHRYQVGFSGDTYTSWETLAFLPWFTATASNVGYGYWGHDIGGHLFRKGDTQTDPELYLRWLQYAVFTPIFKTHCTKNAQIERRIWQFPDHLFDMRAAIRLRYTLAPYIYKAARQTFDTGVSMCRPMYYSHPEQEEAYTYKEQFMFGDDMLIAPVVKPVDAVTHLAEREVWFPEGRWFDLATGRMHEGGCVETLHFTLAENPCFVRAGAIIPMNPATIRNLQEPCDQLILTFVPGADGATTLYEDDGRTKHYATEYATTRVAWNQQQNRIRVVISPREGTYGDAPEARRYELRFPAQAFPKQVRVNGRELAYSRYPQEGEWSYDGYTLAPVIHLGATACNQPCEVELLFDANDTAVQERLYGKQGLFNRLVQLSAQFKLSYAVSCDSYSHLPNEYLSMSQTPNFIQEYPSDVQSYVEQFDALRMQCVEQLTKRGDVAADFLQRLEAQLADF